jgi:hypothetical protein
MHKPLLSAGIVAFLVGSLAISTSAAPDWRGTIQTVSGNVPCDAGGVTGTVGELTAFSSTGGGSSAMTTTGGVGAKWDGQQFDHTDAAHAQKLNVVIHQYARFSTDPATFTVDLTSTISQTGSAHQSDPNSPGWWWDSQALVQDYQPVCALWTTGTGWVPYTPTISTDQRALAVGGDAGNQHPAPPNAPTSNNNNATNPPSSTSQITGGTTNGAYSSTSALPTSGGSYKVQVSVNFKSDGSACVDNAVVTNDKLELNSTLTTSAQ